MTFSLAFLDLSSGFALTFPLPLQVLSIVKTLADNLSIPVFVKIRLLSSVKETITLCSELAKAGAVFHPRTRAFPRPLQLFVHCPVRGD